MLPYTPLADAPLSEVLARVTFRLIQLEASKAPPHTIPLRTNTINQLYLRLEPLFPAIATWLIACNYWCRTRRLPCYRWKADVTLRARLAERNRRTGKPWQRVG